MDTSAEVFSGKIVPYEYQFASRNLDSFDSNLRALWCRLVSTKDITYTGGFNMFLVVFLCFLAGVLCCTLECCDVKASNSPTQDEKINTLRKRDECRCPSTTVPSICSMYGIFTPIWVIFGVNGDDMLINIPYISHIIWIPYFTHLK